MPSFAEGSSGDDAIANGDETSDEDEEEDIRAKRNYKSKTSLFVSDTNLWGFLLSAII